MQSCEKYFNFISARKGHINSLSEIWHKKQTKSVGVDARTSTDMETPVTVQIVSIGIIGKALLFDTPQIFGSFACLNHQTTLLDAI